MTNDKLLHTTIPKILFVGTVILALGTLFSCTVSETPPTDFVLGEETRPAHGCVLLRKENPDADC